MALSGVELCGIVLSGVEFCGIVVWGMLLRLEEGREGREWRLMSRVR